MRSFMYVALAVLGLLLIAALIVSWKAVVFTFFSVVLFCIMQGHVRKVRTRHVWLYAPVMLLIGATAFHCDVLGYATIGVIAFTMCFKAMCDYRITQWKKKVHRKTSRVVRKTA